MDKTPWYPAHIKPVRVGWYEIGTAGASEGEMMFWDGRLLWWQCDRGVGLRSGCGPLLPGDLWRGLTKP